MLILAGVYDISMTLNDGVNDEVKDEVKDKACAMAGAGQGQAGEGQPREGCHRPTSKCQTNAIKPSRPALAMGFFTGALHVPPRP
jgi:hypothetical protein